MIQPIEASSSGHKLGQIVGDWYEKYFALPILEDVAQRLGLYLDNRYKKRACRGEKILWEDSDGNLVDFDFVFEINGTEEQLGIPISFFETFWRRGSRHSKDKARDDTGKLIPMRSTFPTARVLGIISAGDFTEPARELVKSRGVDLFYVNKENILKAWEENNLIIDYPDKSTEEEKKVIANKVINKLSDDPNLLKKIAESLKILIKQSEIDSYKMRIMGILGSMPQSFSVQIQQRSEPINFNQYSEVDLFLNEDEPEIVDFGTLKVYSYNVVFSNGDTFLRDDLKWEDLKKLHEELKILILKMEKIKIL
jgi:hypothetical protein